ncbi:MAG: MATE family efflux transporter, partial [Lachnospiraceae bacterium]|nr:MATE family efflux transporter [Lachnospiraceae bacterium]
LMMVIVLGGVPTIMSVTFAHLLRNSGHAREASIGLSGGGILNMLLDPLFMFVILPDGMEVLGAGIATCLSNVIAFIFLGTVLYRASKNGPLSMRLSDARRIRPQDFRQFFAVGIPAFSLTGLFDLAAIVLNALMAGHGDLQVAAIGIVMKAERLPTAINIGLCQGMLPIVAFNSTSGDRKRMEAVISYVRKLGVMISLIAIVLFQIFAVPLCGVFMSTSLGNGEKAAATLVFAATFLHIRCLVSPFQFLNYHTSHCLQAVGAGRETMLHALMRELVFYIPMMFIFNKLFGLYGLVASIITGEACGALTALALLNRWKRQHPV